VFQAFPKARIAEVRPLAAPAAVEGSSAEEEELDAVPEDWDPFEDH
jgi:hypothetical protein